MQCDDLFSEPPSLMAMGMRDVTAKLDPSAALFVFTGSDAVHAPGRGDPKNHRPNAFAPAAAAQMPLDAARGHGNTFLQPVLPRGASRRPATRAKRGPLNVRLTRLHERFSLAEII
jgi:hypothetical protein